MKSTVSYLKYKRVVIEGYLISWYSPRILPESFNFSTVHQRTEWVLTYFFYLFGDQRLYNTDLSYKNYINYILEPEFLILYQILPRGKT